MRKSLSLFLIILAALFLTGMGGLGGQPSATTPETREDIAARVVDRQGTTIELSQFSMEGNVFIKGDIGSGNLTVPMKNIQKITFGEIRGEFVPVTVLMKSGEKIELQMSKRFDFYGNMSAGAYRIEASRVKEISFD
ncbi:MAG: hypothetical protein R6V08_01340 [Desulfuromonadales bacterium]